MTLGCILATNCDPVIFFRVYYFTACKGIQDSLGFWIPRLGLRIPGTRFQSLSVVSGAWPRSPDSTSKNFPGSGFLNEKFPGFWNQDSLKLGELLRGNHTTLIFSVNLLLHSIIIALTAFYIFSLI